MDTRSSTPDAPPQDLWSSILDSVSSTRSIPCKQIVVLGQPSSGKSTLVSALLQKPASDEGKEDQRVDFALGYDFADVRDDADEDTLARLSVYTVPSSSQSYKSLLPHFLPPRTALPHTLALIVLDWTRPWTFVDELETWLEWIETWTSGDSSREAQIACEESRERLQAHLQHYTEPSTEPVPASSSLSSTILPLGSGTLTHNSSGVPIIVACTKADLIDEGHDLIAGASGMGGMVKGKGGDWEEMTDGVMQVLRTICLKYGAALFYTTQMPATLKVLRQYALHLLFAPPAPAPGMPAADAPVPTRNSFPFQHKPNTLDRDHIVVPAGWDSWGKISVMREFDPKMWGEAWDRDMDSDGQSEEIGSKKLFAALVPDQSTKPPPLPPFTNPIPEQLFLAKNYDENSKKPDRDPRGAFRNPAELDGTAAGIVGPLGSSSFNLPTVERALSEMEVGIGGNATAPDPVRRRAAAAGRPTPLVNAPSPTNHAVRPPPSPNPAVSSPSPTGGQSQHEVLQNFFQSLLSTRPAAATTRGSPSTNGHATAEDPASS
ncbi:dynein light intermediate chain-domain-containing protein [Mycena floridula]|nr:dynein light intermediate chain-domain-containing protein [Mycena floridula]